jgi:anti-sigma-K factor RskA
MNDDDLNALAGEYVLGLLQGEALAQAQARLRDDPHFAALAQNWERALMPLAEASPAIAPPPGLWERIRASTNPAPKPIARLTARLSRRVRLGIAGLATALAVASLLFTLYAPPQAGRQIAALTNRDGGSFIVMQTKSALTITPQNVILPAGRVAELWLLAPGHAPQALGVFQAGQAIILTLPQPHSTGLALAVSLEPPGGAPGPAPSGPIIAEGAITNL